MIRTITQGRVTMIGELINRFDSLRTQTVSDFNGVFIYSPLPWKVELKNRVIELEFDWQVEIGSPFGGTTREIIITTNDGFQFTTFIELKTDDNFISKKKTSVEQQRKLVGGMISSIINGTYQSEQYGQGSSGANIETSNGIGSNDSEAIQEMDEE